MSHYRQPLHCALHSTDIVLHYAQYRIALCTAYADIWTVAQYHIALCTALNCYWNALCTISDCTVYCLILIFEKLQSRQTCTFHCNSNVSMCARVRIIVELRKRLVGKTAGHFPILTSTVCWSQFLQKSFKIYQKLSKIFQNPPKDTKTFDFPFRKFFGVNSLLKIQNRLELSYLDIEIGNKGS